MYRFYLATVDMLPAMILLIPAYWILNILYFHNTAKSIYCCLFSCYLAVVYVLVGMPTVAYLRPELNLNLIPILGMVNDWKNSVLNVCLFIPMGLALPIGWKRFRKRHHTICFGFCISLGIELLQMLTFRATDVNDVITNTLGTYLGYRVATVIMEKNPAIGNIVRDEKTHELFVILGILLGIMFFLYPFVSAALWDWLLA